MMLISANIKIRHTTTGSVPRECLDDKSLPLFTRILQSLTVTSGKSGRYHLSWGEGRSLYLSAYSALK